jgi:2-keto-4-pentenoate hydratase
MVNDLIVARAAKTPVERPARRYPAMTVAEAYALQRQLVEKLIAEQGEVLIGYKLSPKTVPDPADATRQIPVFGFLFQSMVVPAGAAIKRSDFIDLHLENEVAFIIGKKIPPQKISSPADLKPYIAAVAPAIEMPDIRYVGPIDDITGIDLVVDNVVASQIMLGVKRSTAEVDADRVEVRMTRNGELVNEGSSTLVEGSPWNALFWLVKTLEARGGTLKPRQVVMTGGIAKFMDGLPGRYEATYEGLGTIQFTVE